MARHVAVEPCPCGQAARYEDCCGRFHAGAAHLTAPSAEALMRSRYAAYVFGLDAYLLETWHPRTRPLSIAPAPPGLRWVGLEVRRHVQIDADQATVEFVARSKLAGRAERMHETSHFERVDGRWFYVDALSDKA
jgi:SEC-C motif-containing protein